MNQRDFYKEMQHFIKTKIPRCILCKKDYIKVKENSGKFHSGWKPNCKCIKGDLRLSIG